MTPEVQAPPSGRSILLVGGASETAPLAEVLLGAGHHVLASLATGTELGLPSHGRLAVRRGRLDRDGFRLLLRSHDITHVVDASHPFARELRGELDAVCSETGIARIRYERAPSKAEPGISTVGDHEAAARLAASFGRPILLTTGSRNLPPYLEEARSADLPLFARVLPGEESERACRLAGFPAENIAFARGPFSVEQTRSLIRRWGIGVLVAKDGGLASGLADRLEAARLEGVVAVLVRRPDPEAGAAISFQEVLERIDPSRPSSSPSNHDEPSHPGKAPMDQETHARRSRTIQGIQRRKMSQATGTKGLLIVNTGPGKGKTSAAMGMGMRIAGHGKRLAVVQFIKSRSTAERAILEPLPQVEWHVIGDGFTWDTQDLEGDKATARRGWEQARRHLSDPGVDMVILDELCIVLAKGYLPLDEVLADLARRPPHQHAVLTGRGAPPGLVEVADMVNEIRAVKHPFRAGIAAQAGVEF